MARRLSLLVFAVALLLPASALAVWGGAPDGDGHPSVGAMYFDFDGSGTIEFYELICSGSYAGPSIDGQHDVFLTAGHCPPPAEAGIPAFLLHVSFDNDGKDGFDSLIPAEEYHVMPGFGHDLGDLRDLGVLLLPAGSVDVPAVELPPANYMKQLKRNGELKFRTVDIVGYGVTPVWDLPGRTFFDFDGERKAGTSVIAGLVKSNVRYHQNPNSAVSTGSGVCFGDSGSPQLDEGTLTVLSVTSGGNGQCIGSNYNYRVDTELAREFLSQFLALP